MSERLTQSKRDRAGGEGGSFPSALMTWLSPAAQARPLRWPLTPLQTWIMVAVLLGLVAITLIMMFPVLPPEGPVWLIYKLHDAFVLPIRGRIFQRYAPVPQITIAVVIGLAVAAVFARRRSIALYDAVLLWMLGLPAARKVLMSWVSFAPHDAPLHSAIEALYQRAFARALTSQESEDAASANMIAHRLFELEIEPNARNAISRAGVAAREDVLFHVLGGAQREGAWSGLGQFEAPFEIIRSPETSIDARSAEIERLWSEVSSMPISDRKLAFDTLLWISVVGGLCENDASLPRSLQQRLAERAARHILAGRKDEAMLFDPLVWVVDPGLAPGQSFPGMALTGHKARGLAAEISEAEAVERDR